MSDYRPDGCSDRAYLALAIVMAVLGLIACLAWAAPWLVPWVSA